MKFTIVGARGFVGSAVAASLRAQGHDVFAPQRDSSELFSQALGHVIYAAGITADFRTRPFDTLRAHTGLLSQILEKSEFASCLYLSSARVYRHADTSSENATIFVQPEDPEDLYDLTKLTGEALCHAVSRPGVRVVRLSNVVGPNFHSRDFLFDLIRSACETGEINLRTAPESAKDYVMIEDVVNVLPRLAVDGRHGCYNLGSGSNLTHAALVERIVAATGARLTLRDQAPLVISPALDIARLRAEFAFRPLPVLERIAGLVDQCRNSLNAEN